MRSSSLSSASGATKSGSLATTASVENGKLIVNLLHVLRTRNLDVATATGIIGLPERRANVTIPCPAVRACETGTSAVIATMEPPVRARQSRSERVGSASVLLSLACTRPANGGNSELLQHGGNKFSISVPRDYGLDTELLSVEIGQHHKLTVPHGHDERYVGGKGGDKVRRFDAMVCDVFFTARIKPASDRAARPFISRVFPRISASFRAQNCVDEFFNLRIPHGSTVEKYPGRSCAPTGRGPFMSECPRQDLFPPFAWQEDAGTLKFWRGSWNNSGTSASRLAALVSCWLWHCASRLASDARARRAGPLGCSV